MNVNERRNLLVEFINEHKEVDFASIRGFFPDISEMTIRRDLDYLNQHNRIVRVLGGAKSVGFLMHSSEDAFLERSISNVEEKQQIAVKAVKLLKPNSCIFLGSGSTANEFARVMPDGEYMIVTTGMNCAIELSTLKTATVVMLGGTVNKNSYCVNGSLAADMLDKMSFDLAFLGVSGYIPGKGFCTSVVEDYVLRRKIVERSSCNVILMDSGKIGRRSIYTFAHEREIDYLISDNKLDFSVQESLTNAGITVL